MTKPSGKKSWKSVQCKLHTIPGGMNQSNERLAKVLANTLNALGATPGDVILLQQEPELESAIDLVVFTDKEVSDKPYKS